MHSHLAEALPDELQVRLDDLLWEIELWHIRHQLSGENNEEMERERFFNVIVSGVIDCFYFFGWSCRKPVSEMQLKDIWPI